MYNFFTSISKCLKNIYKWKYLFVEKLLTRVDRA